ncbi:hypothetical protein A2866_00310 [Candidatus Roizmanbacteria bacterium RIFCSPHIGHO2_01_FULL_39_8]|uniref:DUF3467 domain-containing protein n=1 Tax=Candidatus Roizmanbacteria bacterium RIFCSPHIGHO2_01_FULL_39_8 TaxID=1802033 RepID=A0A1F7GJK1_9BACT|nr:MAG: hypothetical protein A2866_00310 [Candidatus Roizmanbacteria bacterium RIFCSPHIGHO2_01_FULL_39_8]
MNDNQNRPPIPIPPRTPQGNLNINIDTTPVFYIDVVNWQISADDAVILNFGQKILGSNQAKIVSRVAVTRKFAHHFFNELAKNLALTEAQGQIGKKS